MIFTCRITERVGDKGLKEIKAGLSTSRKNSPVKLDELKSIVEYRVRVQRAYGERGRKFMLNVPYIVPIGGVG